MGELMPQLGGRENGQSPSTREQRMSLCHQGRNMPERQRDMRPGGLRGPNENNRQEKSNYRVFDCGRTGLVLQERGECSSHAVSAANTMPEGASAPVSNWHVGGLRNGWGTTRYKKSSPAMCAGEDQK